MQRATQSLHGRIWADPRPPVSAAVGDDRTLPRAPAIFRAYTLVWEEADTFVAWGSGLLAAGERGAAIELLDAALALYRAHGAGEQWAARVLALRDRPLPPRRERRPPR